LVHKDLVESVVEVLEVVAQYTEGGEYVLPALEYYQNLYNKRSKFEELVKLLDKDDHTMEVKIFSLINHILNNTEDLSLRIEYHNDLLSLGMLPILLVTLSTPIHSNSITEIT
jgi:hypothetical protein